MKNVTLSVIIPTYNSNGKLKRCIENLLISDNKDFEIIIVDDNSDQNEMLNYLKEIKSNPRIRRE